MKKGSHVAISTVLASLLLISATVSSGAIVYTYVMNSAQADQQAPSNFSIFEIPSGSAKGYSITFFLINLGKEQIIFDGSERVYLTTPDGGNYAFSQLSASGNQITFGCSCSKNSTGALYVLPRQTVEFVLWTSFALVPGYSYTVLVVLGDGSETVSTITAH